MGLLDELAADAQKVRRKKPCGVAAALDALKGKDRADLADAVRPDSGYMHSSIARVLTARGMKISEGTVAHHRNGKCACEPHR